MNDKQIETMLRRLVEEYLADDVEAALDWLDRRVAAYESMQDIGLLDGSAEGDRGDVMLDHQDATRRSLISKAIS